MLITTLAILCISHGHLNGGVWPNATNSNSFDKKVDKATFICLKTKVRINQI